MKITIHSTLIGKLPSCFIGKTFEVVKTVSVGDLIEVFDKKTGEKLRAKWESWEGKQKNGKSIRFVRFVGDTKLQIAREQFSAYSWATSFEVEE